MAEWGAACRYDVTAFFGRGAITDTGTEPGGEAPQPRAAQGDHTTGIAMVTGILAALRLAEREGIGVEANAKPVFQQGHSRLLQSVTAAEIVDEHALAAFGGLRQRVEAQIERAGSHEGGKARL